MPNNKSLIVIAGPTAIGKTALSIELAKHYQTVVLSADSRQFFKEMTIGTAKPLKEEMQNIPHFFIDSHSITEEYNVGKYETEAIALLDNLFQQHNTVILTGGSGLYIDAICKGFDELPEADGEVRTKIATLYATEGITGLQNLLKELDEVYYNKVDLQNPQRVSRALEVCLTTGLPYSTLRKGKRQNRSFNIIKIGLNINRELLYQRINKRVDEMINNGLVKEVESLTSYKHLNALQTVGYKELFAYLDNKTDLKTAIELVKQNTRRFAKRQLTWFRRDEEIQWFEPQQAEKIIDYIDSKLTTTA
jgi:tRNA dimethylallyltransferase